MYGDWEYSGQWRNGSPHGMQITNHHMAVGLPLSVFVCACVYLSVTVAREA